MMPRKCGSGFAPLAAALVAAGIVAACGGGGGGSSSGGGVSAPPAANLRGVFSDAPVAGASYYSSTGSGGCTKSAPCKTGSQGQFTFAAGDAVTFSAAGMTLGSTGALQATTGGTTTVTPVQLVPGATSAADPGATAIAQFLQTLSLISASTTGSGATGVLTVPADTSTLNKLGTALPAPGTAVTSITAAQLQTAINAAFGVNVFTVVPATQAQAALAQGVNSIGVAGSAWTGSCTCGGTAASSFYLYFQPDGKLAGFTSDGGLLAGSWAGSTSAGAGVTIQAVSSGGGYGNGSISANTSGVLSGSVTIYDSHGVLQGTAPITELTGSSTALASGTQYGGGWYATFTPNAAALAAGNKGGSAYLIAAPDGTIHGITDSLDVVTGTLTSSTGAGTASFTTRQSQAVTLAFDLSAGTGTVTIAGVASGTLSFGRAGTLTVSSSSGSSSTSTALSLGVAISWANAGNTVSSFPLQLSVLDSTGNIVASTIKQESTAPSSTGIRTTTTDTLAVSYPSSGATYRVGAGGVNCSVTGGSGAVGAGSYPVVNVTCDPTLGGGNPIPLLLNVTTNWGTTYPAPGYGLSLSVKNSTGGQVASGFLQQNVTLPVSNGQVQAAVTTNNIAASYPAGSGATYSLTVGASYCSIASCGAGTVVDANSGKPAAYATVVVNCP